MVSVSLPSRLLLALVFNLVVACAPDAGLHQGVVIQTGMAADAQADASNRATKDTADGATEEPSDAPVGADGKTMSETQPGDADSADATASSDGSLADTPVFDVVAGYDGGAPGDLGTPFDPDVWQELPSLQDSQGPDVVGQDAMGPDAVGPDVVGPDAVGPDDATAELSGADAEPGDAEPGDVVPGDVVPGDASQPDATEADTATPADAADAAPQDTVPLPDAEPDSALADQAAEVAPAEVVDDAGAVADQQSGPGDTADAASDLLADAGAADSAPEVADQGGADAASGEDALQDADPTAGNDGQVSDSSTQDVADDSGTAAPCFGKSCDDGEPCTLDTCEPSGQCSHLGAPEGSTCKDGQCHAGFCSRNTPQQAGLSCKALLQGNAKALSGVWWLDPDGPLGTLQPFPAWCEMIAEGGGWTMALKVGATDSELDYDSKYWTNIAPLHPEHPRLDGLEAKLDSFWTVPFSEVRVGLNPGKQVAWLVIPAKAASLHQIFVSGAPLPTNVSLNKWLGLLPGSVLQPNCNLQGFNLAPGAMAKYDFARVRIGVLGNLENDCASPDSRLGIGGGGTTCEQDANLTSGNAAGCLKVGDPVNLPAVGYVFVR